MIAVFVEEKRFVVFVQSYHIYIFIIVVRVRAVKVDCVVEENAIEVIRQGQKLSLGDANDSSCVRVAKGCELVVFCFHNDLCLLVVTFTLYKNQLQIPNEKRTFLYLFFSPPAFRRLVVVPLNN
jgi:hypothetical protein